MINLENLRSMSNSELENVIKLCIGRVLRLGSRSTQPGDVEQYEKCSRLSIEANEILNERR